MCHFDNNGYGDIYKHILEKSSPQISVSTVDVLVLRGIPRQRPATPALVREGRRGVAPKWHNNQQGPSQPLVPATSP